MNHNTSGRPLTTLCDTHTGDAALLFVWVTFRHFQASREEKQVILFLSVKSHNYGSESFPIPLVCTPCRSPLPTFSLPL